MRVAFDFIIVNDTAALGSVYPSIIDSNLSMSYISKKNNNK